MKYQKRSKFRIILTILLAIFLLPDLLNSYCLSYGTPTSATLLSKEPTGFDHISKWKALLSNFSDARFTPSSAVLGPEYNTLTYQYKSSANNLLTGSSDIDSSLADLTEPEKYQINSILNIKYLTYINHSCVDLPQTYEANFPMVAAWNMLIFLTAAYFLLRRKKRTDFDWN